MRMSGWLQASAQCEHRRCGDSAQVRHHHSMDVPTQPVNGSASSTIAQAFWQERGFCCCRSESLIKQCIHCIAKYHTFDRLLDQL